MSLNNFISDISVNSNNLILKSCLEILNQEQIKAIHRAFKLQNDLNMQPKNHKLQESIEKGIFNRKRELQATQQEKVE